MTDDEKLAQLDFADPRQALEHAKAALAGDNEGVRLWMLDCGELVARHRDRAETAEAKLAAFEAHRPAVLDALRMAAADTAYSSRAGRFTASLEALDGSEEATRDG